MDAEDVLIWPHSQDGQYSCKSGYWFLMDEEAMDIAQDDVITDSKLWKGIWTLLVPNKVKNQLWCVCHNALPTKASLVHRTIINDPLCDHCHEAYETPVHALWDCKELDTVWVGSELSQLRQDANFLDFKELLSWLLQQHDKVEVFAMTTWLIWTQRNQVRLHLAAASLH